MVLAVWALATHKMEIFERVMNKAFRKWFGVPRCLSTVALYGKGILELPMTSLVEFRCAKISLEKTLSQSKHSVVKNTEKTGKKWNP